MAYLYFTNVPNIVFDTHLKQLGYAELKILLVIIRQTYGWVDKRTGKHKNCDWVSQQFFVRKTGLSGRSVSTAITQLISKHLIKVTSKKGKVLISKNQRRRESKLYFSCTFIEPVNLHAKK